MQKLIPIVNLVFKILAIILMAVTSILSLATAYIVFAPDNLPKPFQLVYQYPTPSPTLTHAGGLLGNKTPAAEAAAPTKVVKPGEGLMVNMSTKIINLSDPSGRKYIRVTVVLEFYPEPEKAAAKNEEGAATPIPEQLTKINARMPLMDDLVITILSTKSYDQLYTADGKETLRKEILETINKRLPELHLISVYFTEFVVQ